MILKNLTGYFSEVDLNAQANQSYMQTRLRHVNLSGQYHSQPSKKSFKENFKNEKKSIKKFQPNW